MDFIEWLDSEMRERGWKVADLARSSKLSQGHLSRIIARERLIGLSAARSIARAFGLPEEDVLRRAGLLRPTWQQIASEDFTIGEIVDAVRQMDKAERLELLRYARYRQSLSKSDESGEPSNKSKRLNRVEPDAQ